MIWRALWVLYLLAVRPSWGLMETDEVVQLFQQAWQMPENQCRMSWMRSRPRMLPIECPALIKATPFELRLYTEAHEKRSLSDLRLRKGAQPVLFIPGSSGSAAQIRSIATYFLQWSEDQTLPYTPPTVDDIESAEVPSYPFEFFSLHTSEALTAFSPSLLATVVEHTSTALACINEFYREHGLVSVPRPWLLGHSMGGLAVHALPCHLSAAAAPVMALSLASPLHLLPWENDPRMLALQDAALECIAQQYDEGGKTLHVALRGGLRDFQISPFAAAGHELANIAVTATSSRVWDVQRSIDHQCLMWCKELVVKVALLLVNLRSIAEYDDTDKMVRRARTTLFQHSGIMGPFPLAHRDKHTGDWVKEPSEHDTDATDVNKRAWRRHSLHRTHVTEWRDLEGVRNSDGGGIQIITLNTHRCPHRIAVEKTVTVRTGSGDDAQEDIETHRTMVDPETLFQLPVANAMDPSGLALICITELAGGVKLPSRATALIEVGVHDVLLATEPSASEIFTLDPFGKKGSSDTMLSFSRDRHVFELSLVRANESPLGLAVNCVTISVSGNFTHGGLQIMHSAETEEKSGAAIEWAYHRVPVPNGTTQSQLMWKSCERVINAETGHKLALLLVTNAESALHVEVSHDIWESMLQELHLARPWIMSCLRMLSVGLFAVRTGVPMGPGGVLMGLSAVALCVSIVAGQMPSLWSLTEGNSIVHQALPPPSTLLVTGGATLVLYCILAIIGDVLEVLHVLGGMWPLQMLGLWTIVGLATANVLLGLSFMTPLLLLTVAVLYPSIRHRKGGTFGLSALRRCTLLSLATWHLGDLIAAGHLAAQAMIESQGLWLPCTRQKGGLLEWQTCLATANPSVLFMVIQQAASHICTIFSVSSYSSTGFLYEVATYATPVLLQVAFYVTISEVRHQYELLFRSQELHAVAVTLAVVGIVANVPETLLLDGVDSLIVPCCIVLVMLIII
eukprot:Clim_evm9s166 gene=Clim_evmTU9s166